MSPANAATPASATDEAIGAGLRMSRTLAGLSLATLADRTGLSPQVVAEFEAGVRTFKPKDLLIMAKACGVSMASLLSPVGANETCPDAEIRRASGHHPR